MSSETARDVEQARPDSNVWEEKMQATVQEHSISRTGLGLVVPPTPPAKDTETMPAVTRPSPTHQTTPTQASTKSIPAPKPPRPLPLQQPIRPLGMNPPTRPGTAVTEKSRVEFELETMTATIEKRVSRSSYGTSKRRTKYGKGKFSNIELNPQPSDDPDDPLNWPQWKKELNFGALLLLVSMTGVMKSALVSVNHLLAEDYNVSYTAVSALTGVPLMLSAITGLASLIAARIWGKRPLYLASLLLLFIGTTWNTNVATSYGQCMVARIFQGLGWGAFDTLVMSSVYDTYFEHERCRRVAVYSIVAVATTWGPPLLGGLASRSSTGFGLQFAVLSIFFITAVPLMVLYAPETAFDRAYNMAQTPATARTFTKSLPLAPRKTLSIETLQEYVIKHRPVIYTTTQRKATFLHQVPRAMLAPTPLLIFLVTFLPLATLWGLTSSLSLLFSPLPFNLPTTTLGLLTTGPFLVATTATALFALWPNYHISFTATRTNTIAITIGSAAAFTSLLTLGLHLHTSMSPSSSSTGFTLSYLPNSVSLPLISFLLGLLALSVAVLDSTARPLIRRSTAFTSSHLGVALKNTAEMDASVSVWRTFVAGMFVMGFPNAVCSWEGLKATCVGAGVVQVLLGMCVAGVWWFWDEEVRRADGRVMRCVDLGGLEGEREGSFFDLD